MLSLAAALLAIVSTRPVLEIRQLPAPLGAGWSMARTGDESAALAGRLPERAWIRVDLLRPEVRAEAGTSWLRLLLRLGEDAARQPLALRIRPLAAGDIVYWDGVALTGLPLGNALSDPSRPELLLELPVVGVGRHELLIRHAARHEEIIRRVPVLDRFGRSLSRALANQRPAAICAVAIATLGFLCLLFYFSDRTRHEIGLYAALAIGVALHVTTAAPAWLPMGLTPPGLARILSSLTFVLPALTTLVVLRFLDLRLAPWQRAALLLPLAGTLCVWFAPPHARWLTALAIVSLVAVTSAAAVPLAAPAVRRRPEAALVFVGAGFLLLAAVVDAGCRLGILLTDGPDLPAVGPAFLVFTSLLLLIVADQGQRLLARATTDPLTNLSNRAEFWKRAERELQRAGRTERSVALVILDLDHFKSINDTYGHPVGDKVLAAVASAIAETLRGVDLSGRYGGEEFVILLVEIDEATAFQAVERVRAAIAALAPPRVPRPITVSAGVALHQPIFERTTVRDLVKRADVALYAAKRAGRNRTTVESTRSAEPTSAAEVRFR
ncbi:MAG: diguanylate cyclase [Thermoanaerobaculia bacterium]